MTPKRAVFQSRGEQVLSYLREQVATGQWQQRLPPERALAAQLGVSRWSLRAALKELQNEGIIGKRSQAGTRLAGPPPETPPSLSVGIVVASKANLANGRILFTIDSMRHHLQAREVRLEVHKTPHLQGPHVSAHFRRLLREVHHDCWALMAPTTPMQTWCRDQNIPAVVLGTGDEAAGLPSASMDHYATGRHAVGTLLRLGHRRLALLLPSNRKGEDHQVLRGVVAAINETRHAGASCLVETHDQSLRGVCRLADQLLGSPANQRPTAWLICRQGHFLTLYSYLLSKGIRLPEDLSILSRDWMEHYSELTPQPAHYRVNRAILSHHYARLALRVAAGQSLPGETIRLMPEFIPGETLGRVQDS